MNIGQASKASGVPAKMIRYYESIGLIDAPPRTHSGYRVYAHEDVHTLRFIKRARTLGFSIDETTELLALWRDKSRASADVKSFALKHMRDLEMKVRQLKGMIRSLRHLAHSCHGDDRPDCPIINDLADAGGEPPPVEKTSRNRVAAMGKHTQCRCPAPIMPGNTTAQRAPRVASNL